MQREDREDDDLVDDGSFFVTWDAAVETHDVNSDVSSFCKVRMYFTSCT